MTTKRDRRPGVRKTAGLIVEGDTEFAALPLLHTKKRVPQCPPLRAINLGGVGSHLEPIGIAKMVKPKVLQHMVADRSPIIVCIDREQRTIGADKLASDIFRALKSLLDAENRSSDGVHVAIADRTFEAWILADARGLYKRRIFQHAPTFHKFEGEMGKNQKKGLVELGELLGRPYGKTTDGPRLFEQVTISEARKCGPKDHGSRSLDNFLHMLGV